MNKIYLLIVSLTMAFIDVFLTYVGITNNLMGESNPFTAYIIYNYGFKMLLAVTIVILLIIYKYAPNLLILCIITNLIGVIVNTSLITA